MRFRVKDGELLEDASAEVVDLILTVQVDRAEWWIEALRKDAEKLAEDE